MYDKILIVAHTDDELLWGWRDLIDQDNWLVICVFQQYNFPGADKERQERLQKFKDVSVLLKHEIKIFNYIDNPYNLDIDFSVQNNIKQDLTSFIRSDIKKIVTHNPDGEYGHYHHRLISKLVTDIITDKNKLYYFSYDLNINDDFPELYIKSFLVYFKDQLHDETVQSHKKLSKICKSIVYNDYKSNKDLINNTYPEWLLKCNIITCTNYL